MRVVTNIVVLIAAWVCATSGASAQQSWIGIQTPIAGVIKGVDLPAAGVVVAVGDGGSIARSEDGGLTWELQSSGTTVDLWAVRFWSADSGVAVGDEGTILTTYDAGATWTRRESGLDAGSNRFLFSVARTGGKLVAVGGEAGSYSGVVLTSSDQGVTWSKVLLRASLFLDRIAFVDTSTAVAVGMHLATGGGGIYRTTDGGASWSVAHQSAQLITSVVYLGNSAIAIGSGGLVYTSSDRGATWISAELLPGTDLLDIAFDAKGNGMVVGDLGSTLVTRNGGSTWAASPIENSGILSDVVIDAADATAYVAGTAGVIYRSVVSAHVVETESAQPDIRIDGDHIVIEAGKSAIVRDIDVAVYDMLGRRFSGARLEAGATRIPIPAGGAWLVVCRNAGGEVIGVGKVSSAR